MIKNAFILGAGFGSRMRPLTETTPKPLIKLAGKALIDHVIEGLIDVGVTRIVVNVHYLADQLEDHLAGYSTPEIIISDERSEILDTGGGAAKALPFFGDEPFFIHNSDTVWIEGEGRNLAHMLNAFDPTAMDCLMLLANRHTSLGYDGKGDFLLGQDNRITRRPKDTASDFVFAGVSINTPKLFTRHPEGAFSLNELWDNAIATGRAHGIRHQGKWMHVGTSKSLEDAEHCISASRCT